MSENFMIIKTRKLSAREVKKKLRDFIDEISDGCSPEIEQMADELKDYGDQFVDALSGNSREGGSAYRRDGSGMAGGGYNRDTNYSGSHFRQGGRAWHRNEGTWEEREELRKKNEQKLQELDRQMQELKQHMQDL